MIARDTCDVSQPWTALSVMYMCLHLQAAAVCFTSAHSHGAKRKEERETPPTKVKLLKLKTLHYMTKCNKIFQTSVIYFCYPPKTKDRPQTSQAEADRLLPLQQACVAAQLMSVQQPRVIKTSVFRIFVAFN